MAQFAKLSLISLCSPENNLIVNHNSIKPWFGGAVTFFDLFSHL